MTDHDDDLVLSRLLDGDDTTEDRARLAADPDLRRRLAALRAAAAAPPPEPLAAAEVDRLVATALAAADRDDGPAAPAPTSLDAHRRRRRGLLVSVGAAAAALVAVAVALPLLDGLDDGGDADQAAQVDDASDGEAGDAEAGGLAGPTAESEGEPGDLGPLEDLDEVAAALAEGGDAFSTTEGLDGVEPSDERATTGEEEATDAVPSTTSPAAGEPDAVGGDGPGPVPPGTDPLRWCASTLPAVDDRFPTAPDDRLTGAALTYRDEGAVAYRFALDGEEALVVVLDAGACAVLAGPQVVPA